jgi:hypothetical protein
MKSADRIRYPAAASSPAISIFFMLSIVRIPRCLLPAL